MVYGRAVRRLRRLVNSRDKAGPGTTSNLGIDASASVEHTEVGWHKDEGRPHRCANSEGGVRQWSLMGQQLWKEKFERRSPMGSAGEYDDFRQPRSFYGPASAACDQALALQL